MKYDLSAEDESDDPGHDTGLDRDIQDLIDVDVLQLTHKYDLSGGVE